MEEIDLDKTVDPTKSVSATESDEVKSTTTTQEGKGVSNLGMDYDKEAMTSPTKLLAPEAFPDCPDLNGNAMSFSDEKLKETILFHRGRRSCCKVRCLVFALVAFILMTAVMAGLFAWRTISSKATKSTEKKKSPCYVRENPVQFDKLPVKIEEFLEKMGNEIKSKIYKSENNIVMMNVVYYDKVIWQANYAVNDSKIQNGMNYTVYPVASVTKVFTSLLAFKLHNDGIISSLHDSITKYEPKFRVQNPFGNDNGKQITIRQLLSFESGLPREAPCYPDNKHNYCPHNHSYILERLNKIKLLFPPGSDILYGNLQFALAGHAFGKNYTGGFNQLVNDKVFAPFGMKSSYFDLSDSIKEKVYAPVYVSGKSQPLRKWGWLEPAGGLLTTIDDLAKFEIALFNNSESDFLRPAILDEFFSPVYLFSDGIQMTGFTWNIILERGYSIFIKTGYVYGYYSGIIVIPHLKLALNVFTTSYSVMHQIFVEMMYNKLTNLFHDELKKSSTTKMRMKGVTNPKKYVGIYRTTEVPTLLADKTEIYTNRIVNGNEHVLAIKLDVHRFDLTYLEDDIFEMVHKQCEDFQLGVNREKIYFKESSDFPKQIDKFVIYGIHLRGIATFYRKNKTNI